MKMWTQGLGNVELVIYPKDMEAELIEGNTVMTGITAEPIQWNYTITLVKEDVPAVMNVIFQKNTLLWAYRNKGIIISSIFKALFSKKKVQTQKAMEGNAS